MRRHAPDVPLYISAACVMEMLGWDCLIIAADAVVNRMTCQGLRNYSRQMLIHTLIRCYSIVYVFHELGVSSKPRPVSIPVDKLPRLMS